MVCFVSLALHCIAGSICSGLAVLLLLNHNSYQDDKVLIEEKKKSAMTIFLMNVPHFITVGCIFTSIVSPQGISWFDINFIFCPIITSTLNPILIVSRGMAIENLIRTWFEMVRQRTESYFGGGPGHRDLNRNTSFTSSLRDRSVSMNRARGRDVSMNGARDRSVSMTRARDRSVSMTRDRSVAMTRDRSVASRTRGRSLSRGREEERKRAVCTVISSYV